MNESEINPKPRPIAILHLPDSKARMVMVYGRSGKRYTFQAHAAAGGRPARLYTDEATFLQEEGDLRRNLRTSLAVCTLLGERDALERASDAVREIASGKKHVGSVRARERLLAVLEEVKAGLALVEGARDGNAEGAENAEEKEEAGLPADAGTESMGDGAEADAGTPAERGEKQRVWRKAELQQMDIAGLRTVAKQRGISASRRDDMVAGILKKQKEDAA
jgi:hypothetical protein